MTTAAEQRAWLGAAASHLEQDGVLVVEMGTFNPQLVLNSRDFPISERHMIRSSTWNPVTQRLCHHYTFKSSKGMVEETRDYIRRALFPEELLLMAELGGLRTEVVWSNWSTGPFDENSRNMVAVFKKIGS